MPDDGWRAVNWAWERREEILRLLARLRAWWKNEGRPESAPVILILGPGGAGKTTLARFLSGEFALPTESPGRYDPSIGTERYAIPGGPVVEVVVPPGQQHRREATWAEFLSAVAAGRTRGLVFVTAYGHESLERTSYRDHPLYAGNKDKFVDDLVAAQRADELAVLSRVLDAARLAPGRLWMLSVVGKQDLWWPEQGRAERHYREGEYHALVAGALAGHDRRHEVCFVSLVIQNWEAAAAPSPNPVLLAPNARGYDQTRQAASLDELLKTLESLRAWEGQA